MHFYRPNKKGPSILSLHQQEWSRLKKQAGASDETPSSMEQKEYIDSLIDQSRAWTSTWRDNELGCFAHFEQKKQKQHEDNLAAVEATRQIDKKIKMRKKKRGAEAIKEARQMIFEDSNYGRKLVSALHVSKTMEERDAQLQFMKELKEKKTQEENRCKDCKVQPFCSFQLDKHAADEEKCRKLAAKKLSEENKLIFEKQKVEANKAREDRIQADLENTKLMRELLDLEERTEKEIKRLEKKAIDQYTANLKKPKEERAKREAEYSAQIEICRKQKEQLNAKINRIVQEINKRREELPWAKKIYKELKQLQDKEKERNDVFLKKNIKVGDERSSKREKQLKEKEKQDLEKNRSIVEQNKVLAEYQKQKRKAKVDQCSCDRMSLIVNYEKCRHKKEINQNEESNRDKPSFLGRSTRLKSALMKRMQAPSPWSQGQASHELFASNASKILGECKYKGAVNKVIEEYKKNNKVDNLVIANYK